MTWKLLSNPDYCNQETSTNGNAASIRALMTGLNNKLESVPGMTLIQNHIIHKRSRIDWKQFLCMPSNSACTD